jgi:hypothetical protein
VGVGVGVACEACAGESCVPELCAKLLPAKTNIAASSSAVVARREWALDFNNRISLESPDHAGGHGNAGNNLNVLSGILEDAAPSNFVGHIDGVTGLKQRVDHAP